MSNSQIFIDIVGRQTTIRITPGSDKLTQMHENTQTHAHTKQQFLRLSLGSGSQGAQLKQNYFYKNIINWIIYIYYVNIYWNIHIVMLLWYLEPLEPHSGSQSFW